MFLIDTDVLSMLRRWERNPAVARWMVKQRTADLHLSVVSVGEVDMQIARRWGRRDPASDVKRLVELPQSTNLEDPYFSPRLQAAPHYITRRGTDTFVRYQ